MAKSAISDMALVSNLGGLYFLRVSKKLGSHRKKHDLAATKMSALVGNRRSRSLHGRRERFREMCTLTVRMQALETNPFDGVTKLHERRNVRLKGKLKGKMI